MICTPIKWFDDSGNFILKSNQCRFIYSLLYCQNVIDLTIYISLLILYMIIYKKLMNVMQKKLHYFYQRTKKKIQTLYLSGITYFFCMSVFSIFDIVIEADMLLDFGLNSKFHVGIRIFWLILATPAVICFFCYCYLWTKHIDFVLYVRAWTIGYQVYHKFDNISYLITHSWLYREQEQNSDDDFDDILIRDSSEYSFRSVVKDIGNTRQYSGDLYNSERQTLLEDSTS